MYNVDMDERIPYLAGFIDGEGSIAVGISKNPKGERRWYLRFSVHQVNPAPLLILKEIFGGSINQTKHEEKKTIYEWVAVSMSAYEALVQLRPFLIVKADEADAGIEFQRLLLARGTRRKPLSDEEREARESVYQKLRALKQVEFVGAIEPKVPRVKKPKPPIAHRVKQAPLRSTGYDRKKRPVDDADVGILRGIYEDHGLTETAREYGVSRQTISNWLDQYGIEKMGRTAASELRRRAAVKASWSKE
jgi:hypothetical protein